MSRRSIRLRIDRCLAQVEKRRKHFERTTQLYKPEAAIRKMAIHLAFSEKRCCGTPLQRELPYLCRAILVPKGCWLTQRGESPHILCAVLPCRSGATSAEVPASFSSCGARLVLPGQNQAPRCNSDAATGGTRLRGLLGTCKAGLPFPDSKIAPARQFDCGMLEHSGNK